jgi:Glycosyl hydrolases family 28
VKYHQKGQLRRVVSLRHLLDSTRMKYKSRMTVVTVRLSFFGCLSKMIRLPVVVVVFYVAYSFFLWLGTGGHTSAIPILIDVTEYGVIADGWQDNTLAIQRIFDIVIPDKRRQTRFRSFGNWRRERVVVVLIPFGSVVSSGPLRITCNHLVLQVDGRLQAWDIATNPAVLNGTQWPFIEPLPTYGDSRDGHYYQYQPLLYITDVANFRITGGGIIDGFGQPWWDLRASKSESLQAGRPNLVRIINSSNIEIDSVTFQDSPFWTIHPVLSQSIHIHHITIKAPLYAPNVDGIDPE